jgi:hypothetical protein
MKRLHLAMTFVIMIFAGLALGGLFGGQRGAHLGAAGGLVLAGVFLYRIAPLEYARQVRIIERTGAVLKDPETFRSRFLLGARMPALVLIVGGIVAIVVILVVEY